jgi:hypothetical protein
MRMPARRGPPLHQVVEGGRIDLVRPPPLDDEEALAECLVEEFMSQQP